MGARKKIQKKPTPRAQMPAWVNQRVIGATMLVLVLGSALGMGGWTLTQPNTLPIKSVQVKGEFRYLAQQDVYDALGGLTSGGFFNVDVVAVKLAAESLPWVDGASVRRIWPDTLQIKITEQVPLAVWGKTKVVNARGELFQPPAKGLPEHLPRFVGPEGTEKKVAVNYQLLSEKLAQLDLSVNELRLTKRRAWRMRLANGLQLLLGKTVSDERLERFASAYPKLLGEKVAQIDSVDLRYTNGFAVRLKEPSAG